MTTARLRPFRSYARADAGERRLLREAAMVVAAVRLGLTLIPYRLLRRLSPSLRGLAERAHSLSGTPEALARAVSAVARRIPGATCLTQALALDLLLRRRGVIARLVVGVTNRGERFGAHAWLEYEGRVLIGGDIRHYQPLRTSEHTSQ